MTTYPTDYPVTLRDLPAECDVGDSVDDRNGGDNGDFWGNYDYVDRCMAWWCYVSSVGAIDQMWSTGTFTESYTKIVSGMIVHMDPVYKTTLTASDEWPVDYYSYDYGDLATYIFISTHTTHF